MREKELPLYIPTHSHWGEIQHMSLLVNRSNAASQVTMAQGTIPPPFRLCSKWPGLYFEMASKRDTLLQRKQPVSILIPANACLLKGLTSKVI